VSSAWPTKPAGQPIDNIPVVVLTAIRHLIIVTSVTLCGLKITQGSCNGNSAEKLHHTRSAAYSAELVPLNKHKISGGGAYLHCYCCNY